MQRFSDGERGENMKQAKPKAVRNRIRKSKGEIVFEIVVYAIATLFCIYCLFPFAIILGSSFETESNFAIYGFPIIPRNFTLQAYKMVLGDGQIFRAYGVTIFTTVVGTLISMLLTISMAYPIFCIFYHAVWRRAGAHIPAHQQDIGYEG